MLAIVIPYYKKAFFEQVLNALKNQTDKRFKVYIGDDASPENPIFLLDKVKNDFIFDYHRFNENLGSISLVKQWERCIARSGDEEWIMVLGDDDLVDDNFVASFYLHLEEVKRLGINVIRFATVVINEYGERLSKNHVHPKLEKSTDFLMRKFKGGTRSSLSEFVFKKKTLLEIRFKDLPLAWYSDYLAVLECSYFSYIFTINDSLVYFRLSGLNITSKTDDLVLKSEGTFGFYYYLLSKKKHYFNSLQINIICSKMEKVFLDNKKNIKFWLLISKLYLSNGWFKKYFNLFGSVSKYILKIKKND